MSASSTPLGQTDPIYRFVNFVNSSWSKRSFFLFFGAMHCFLCDMGSIIKDHSSLSYLCQFQVIDDESWFWPKVHCGDRMLGNLILSRIMSLKVERYEDNESRTYETLKEMVVTLIGADGDW